MGAEGFGEGLCLGGLAAGLPGSVDRKADNDGSYFMPSDEAGDGLEIGFERGAIDGEEWLRGVAEGVGQSDTEAAIAYVERENAVQGHGSKCSGG